MPKYRQIFRQMLDENEVLFADFKVLHDKYADDQEKWQREYNEQGKPVIKLIQDWERRLCGQMERGNNAVFSSTLADKFWTEVRAFFPMIDFVGVEYD
jgi:hypothetical protein